MPKGKNGLNRGDLGRLERAIKLLDGLVPSAYPTDQLGKLVTAMANTTLRIRGDMQDRIGRSKEEVN